MDTGRVTVNNTKQIRPLFLYSKDILEHFPVLPFFLLYVLSKRTVVQTLFIVDNITETTSAYYIND